MTWENRGSRSARVPRAVFAVLAVIAVAVATWAVLSNPQSATVLFVAVPLVPWLALMAWMAWRTVVVDSVAIDSAGVGLSTGHGETSVPLSRVRWITLDHGAARISTRAPRGGVLLGREYTLSLSDEELRDLGRFCESVGLRVSRQWGSLFPEDDRQP